MDRDLYRNLHKEEYRKYSARYRARHREEIKLYRKDYVLHFQSPRLKKRYRLDSAYREFRKASSQRRYYEKRVSYVEQKMEQGKTELSTLLDYYSAKLEYYKKIEQQYKLNQQNNHDTNR